MSRLLIVAALLALLAGLAGCGGGGKKSTAVGVGIGVSLSSPAGTTLLQQGATLEVDATVSNDASNAGVTWTLIGPGSLTGSSTTKVTYQAPSGITGSVAATLSAVSITDPTKASSVTLTVNGTPTITPPVLFPANKDVAYSASIGVAGGLAPFTWSITSGTLPAGLTLNGSTSSVVAISGTPTAEGSSTFTLQAIDTNKATATTTLTIVVNPKTACLLLGRYAYLFTGFRDSRPVVRAGSFNVAADGTVTGIQDYKDTAGGRVAEGVTSGTCLTFGGNRGRLTLASGRGSEVFEFATTSTLNSGQLQENDATSVVGSGQYFRQDSGAFPLAGRAGDHAFGVIGDDGNRRRLGAVGRLTLDAAGAVSGGQADTSASTPLVAGSLTGSFAAADANGRGTATLTVGAQALPFAYYVVDADTLFLVTADSSATTPGLGGRMTRQTGAGALDATALAGASVLSLWGSSTTSGLPAATNSAGRLSAGAGGSVTVEYDVSDRGTTRVYHAPAASPYTVTANGRGTLVLGSGARNFVLYLSGTGSGYVLEPASPVGNFGILDPQLGVPITTFPPANYVGGTVFAGSTSPVSLTPQIQLQSGSVSGNLTGNYALDPANGRMIASVNRNILGGSGLVIYVVSTDKLVVLGDGVNAVNSSLAWLQHY